MVDDHGADRAGTVNKAQNIGMRPLAAGAALGLWRVGNCRFVRFNRLAFSPNRRGSAGVHGKPDAMVKEPSGFHAAIEHPLNLPGRNAFVGAAKQVDDLQPQMQRKVAVLKQRAHAHREGLLAGVALVQPWTGRLAVQTANARRFSAVRAYGAIRPKPRLNVRKRADREAYSAAVTFL